MVAAADYTFDKATDSVTIDTALVAPITTDLTINYPGTTDNMPITFDTTTTAGKVTIDTSAIDYNQLNLGTTYTGVLTLSDATLTADETHNIKITPTWCDDGCKGSNLLDLDVEIKNKGMGENDDEWYPFDDIEVEITIDNIYNDGDGSTDDDLKDIVVEWGLYNPDKGKFTDIEDEENDFNLKEGKDNEIILNFNVNPDDFSESTNSYVFYVKAYAEDSKDDLINQENSAVEYFESIDIMRDDFMILDNVIIPSTVQCGETLEITGDVWNIATDQEDDVSMRVYNNELGINEIINLGDIDELEPSDFNFKYTVPNGLSEKLYALEFRVFDEDGDTYEADTDDDSIFLRQFKVEGNCVERLAPTITATLDSSTPNAMAGKEVIIKTTIRNNEDEETIYDVSVFGNSAWSSLSSIDPQSITLGAGESKEVSITLDIDKDAEGDKEFTIRTAYGDQTTEQKVAFSIEKSAVGADKIADHLKTNWFIYVIVIVNLILIIAIISVIKRMVGTTPAAI
jgi:hypothetical protein